MQPVVGSSAKSGQHSSSNDTSVLVLVETVEAVSSSSLSLEFVLLSNLNVKEEHDEDDVELWELVLSYFRSLHGCLGRVSLEGGASCRRLLLSVMSGR